MTKQICKTCYWNDFIDDDDPDFEPCQNCVYDSGHYNWRPKELSDKSGDQDIKE